MKRMTNAELDQTTAHPSAETAAARRHSPRRRGRTPPPDGKPDPKLGIIGRRRIKLLDGSAAAVCRAQPPRSTEGVSHGADSPVDRKSSGNTPNRGAGQGIGREGFLAGEKGSRPQDRAWMAPPGCDRRGHEGGPGHYQEGFAGRAVCTDRAGQSIRIGCRPGCFESRSWFSSRWSIARTNAGTCSWLSTVVARSAVFSRRIMRSR